MNASPSNRERHASGGNGKVADPDRAASRAGGSNGGGNGNTPVASSPPGAAKTSRYAPKIPPAVTDEQLLDGYRQGDKPSFASLVERYQRELFHFLVRFLGDRAAAEDVFQETFLQVHQSADQFDLQRRFRPWLFTIAANKARDLMRSQARRPTNPLQASISPGDEDSGQFIDLMESASSQPFEPLEKAELQGLVQGTVMGMPEHLREILLLSYFHQFPYKQISDILEIPLGTVKSRLHAAVAYFGDRWKATNQNKTHPH
jgi:RNA polymerase sigma-70 factor (ECF subfamily)